LNLSGGLHAFELTLVDDDSLALLALVGLLADVSQLLLGESYGASGCLLGITEKRLVDIGGLRYN